MKMDTILTRPRQGGILFAEDFDIAAIGEFDPNDTADAAAVAPVYAAEDVAQGRAKDVARARAEGWEAGRVAARHEIETADAARARQAILSLASALDAATEAARETADKTADAIARLLLTTLGAVLPTLCAAHGDAEARAVARVVMPGLTAEPAITIRANPHTMPALADEIERIDPDLPARVRMLPTDALLPGDVRISWQDGHAARDTTGLWNEIVAVLLADGLIQPNQAAGAPRHGG